MKKYTLLLALLNVMLCFAQISQTEKDLMKKYWDYRDRYKKHFVKIGNKPGESIPVSLWYKNQNCGDIQGGQIKMGDAMGVHGDYLCLLATEYYLTKKQGNDLTEIKNEIYYALKAIERNDGFAEVYLSSGDESENFNGFILRDDVPLDFYKNWQTTDNVQFLDGNRSNGFLWDTAIDITEPLYYSYPPVPGDSIWLAGTGRNYFKWNSNAASYKPTGLQNFDSYKWYFPMYEPTGTLTCGKIKNDTIFNSGQSVKNNEMSQDHMIGLLAGLTAITKLVDDVMVVPTPQDDTAWLVSMAKVLGRRLLDNVSSEKLLKNPDIADWIVSKKIKDTLYTIDLVPPLPVDLKVNWFITNPITDEQVLIGCISWLFSYPLSEIGNKNFSPSVNYNPNIICKTIDSNPENLITTSIFGTVWDKMGISTYLIDRYTENNIFSLLNNPDAMWDTLCFIQTHYGQLRIFNKTIEYDGPTEDVNNQMICWLGATSGTFSKSEYATLVDTFDMPWFEMLDIVINRKTGNTFEQPVKSRDFYRNLLKLPACDGMRKYNNPDTLKPFHGGSIFSMPHREHDDAAFYWGEYNGIDFMLLYNMYRMVYTDSLPEYKPNACPCNNNETKILETIGTGISSSGNSLKTSVETFFRFPDYKPIGIDIPEYANHSFDIGHTSSNPTATLKINGDLTVCNNSKVSVLQKGKMHLTRSVADYQKELIVKPGSEIYVANGGILEVENLSSLIIEKGAKLTIGQNAHIVLNGSASKLIIEGDLVLEAGVEFKIEYPQDSIPGILVFNSNADRKAAPVKIKATGNNTILNLSSIDDEHTYLIINGQAGIEVDSSIGKVIVTNIGIKLDEFSAIRVYSPLKVENVNASAIIPGVNHQYSAGFFVYGQPNVEIKNSKFYDGIIGIGGNLFVRGNNRPVISNVEFNGCYRGMLFHNGGIKVNDCYFTDNRVGIELKSALYQSDITKCNFENNIYQDIKVHSSSFGSVNVKYSVFDGARQGILSSGARINPMCNIFKNSVSAIYLNDMALLNINAANGSGYNKFEYNSYGVYGKQIDGDPLSDSLRHRTLAGYLDLNNGYSSFMNTNLHIKLSVCNRQKFVSSPNPPNDVFIGSSKNFWSHNANPPFRDSIHYLLDWKPAYSVQRAKGIIFQSNDYTAYADLNMELSNACGWPPTPESELPNDSMQKDCDDKLINTNHFINKLLSEAYTIANKTMYETEYIIDAFTEYKEILLYPILPSTRCESDKYYITKSYENLCYVYSKILNDSLITDSVKNIYNNEMLAVSDSLIKFSKTDSLWKNNLYILLIDRSELFRIEKNYDSSLSILYDLASEMPYNSSLLEKINYHICFNQRENSLLNLGYTEYDADSIFDCNRVFEMEDEVENQPFVHQLSSKFQKSTLNNILLLYPNPTDNYLIIKCKEQIKSFKIFDNLGKIIIASENIKTNYYKLSVKDFTQGIYKIEVILENNSGVGKAFIVK